MSLKEKIQEDFKKAVMAKKALQISVLRMLRAALLNKEKEKRYRISKEKPGISQADLEKESYLSDEEVLGVISSEAKKRKEAMLEFEKGGREDLVKKEKAELDVLQEYLPEQLSEEEIEKLAKQAIEKTGASEPKDIGKVMSELMPRIKDRAEGAMVSKIIKELLSKA